MTTILPRTPSKVTDDTLEKLSEAENPSISNFGSELSGHFAQPSSRISLWSRRRVDGDAIATQLSVFDDPTTLEIYRPPPQYENVHRFDPLFRWKWKEELV
jgi:hypothetical protein